MTLNTALCLLFVEVSLAAAVSCGGAPSNVVAFAPLVDAGDELVADAESAEGGHEAAADGAGKDAGTDANLAPLCCSWPVAAVASTECYSAPSLADVVTPCGVDGNVTAECFAAKGTCAITKAPGASEPIAGTLAACPICSGPVSLPPNGNGLTCGSTPIQAPTTYPCGEFGGGNGGPPSLICACPPSSLCASSGTSSLECL
ncbi:MAG TPA: hypothetical protein VGG39_23515 [Polyangiaceae bacterium]|jgi:hypothetical protein